MPSLDAGLLALAAILVGLTARDVLDGPDAAPPPTVREWITPRRWLRPSRLFGLVPVVATAALAVLVWTTPMETWLWGAVALFSLTVAARRLAHGRRLAARRPTEGEADALSAAGVDPDGVRIVDTRRDQLNGYTLGGPLSRTVGVSGHAVRTLTADQLAALVAHERGHHRGRHALVRAGAGVGWLVAGTAAITATFDSMTPAGTAAVLGLLAGERLVAGAVGRYTEFRADAYAARRTSPAAVAGLLGTLRDATGGRTAPLLVRALSTHPSNGRRTARVESGDPDAE